MLMQPTPSRQARVSIRGHVKDANGRSVKLLDPMPLWVLGRDEPIDRETLEGIVREFGVDPTTHRRLLWLSVGASVAVLVVVVFAITRIVVVGGQSAVHDLMSSLVLFGPMSVMVVIASCIIPILSARRKRWERLERVMIAHGRCPHCGFGIGGLARDDAGLVVCPECSSAWNGAFEAGVSDMSSVESPRRVVILTVAGVLVLLAGCAVMLLW
jgi:ribosomal protein L37AE/L43A